MYQNEYRYHFTQESIAKLSDQTLKEFWEALNPPYDPEPPMVGSGPTPAERFGGDQIEWIRVELQQRGLWFNVFNRTWLEQ